LGISAFENMKRVQLHDASVALFLDDKVRNLNVEREIRAGKYNFEVGKALSVKIIKALTYTFKTVQLIDKPTYRGPEKIDALMRVNLQDVDLNLEVKSGFVSVSSESYSRFAIRAEIKDLESNETVWVGTTQAQTSGKHEEMSQMTYQEAGRGFAAGIDNAIDKVVGDLIHQMRKSTNLSANLKKWEQGS
ncbi:MAG: hypothetical protein ACE5ER_11745, partial [Nitrospinaceae bacterium]